MVNPTVEELATTLRETGVPHSFGPDVSRLLMRLWRRVADGHPVPAADVEQIAADLHVSHEDVTTIVSQMCERDVDGNVAGVIGLSQKAHPHRFQVNGHLLSTWCAWDSLFLPALLKQTAHITSSCPVTKELVRLTVTPERVEHYEPASTVISIIIPKTTRQGPGSVEEIWMAFCHHVHFFRSREAAAAWFAGRKQEVALLSMRRGTNLGGWHVQNCFSTPRNISGASHCNSPLRTGRANG